MSRCDLTLDNVGVLISMRSAYQLEDDCAHIEAVSQAFEAGLSVEEIFLQFPHIKGCSLCTTMVNEFVAIDSIETVISEDRGHAKVAVLGNRRKWIAPVLALAATMLLSLAYFVWHQYDASTTQSTLVPKGMAYDFQIAVSRGDAKFGLASGEQVETGDQLGFFYSAPRSGHIAVFFVDANRQTAILYPIEGETTAHIDRGMKLPLKDGAVVTPANDCEWIVAVFFSGPTQLNAVESQIKETMRTTSQCELSIVPKGAKSVKIQQIRGRK